jgi:hypothetical protein
LPPGCPGLGLRRLPLLPALPAPLQVHPAALGITEGPAFDTLVAAGAGAGAA